MDGSSEEISLLDGGHVALRHDDLVVVRVSCRLAAHVQASLRKRTSRQRGVGLRGGQRQSNQNMPLHGSK